jgi:type I restriction enzyme S subunit
LAQENEYFLNASGNVMKIINTEKQSMLMCPIPSTDEQRKIVEFLDKKCSHIDTVIEKTKASIEEYKKLKQAIITKAVTKGVRDERTMKDSGSVWFGKVPENWEMKKLKYQFHIKKNIAGEEGYTVLSITQKGIKPKDISKNEGQLASDYSNYQLVNPGDFAMNHMDLLTGWVDISNYSGVTSPDYRVFVLNDNEKNNSRYYLYMMQMCYSNKIFYGLGQGVSGLGRWRLQADKFLNFLIAVPTPSEQNEIAEYLDNKCARIDMLIEKKEQFLTELENYKKSLIYEYVTGKKEVL